MNVLRGWWGEKVTAVLMWFSLNTKVYRRFHNVIVPTSNGTTQIDHILVSQYGLFVIETKNIKGWIFGSENQHRWAQTLYGRKYSFQNPLKQNYRHTKCLEEVLNLKSDVLHSIVFFVGDCTLKTPMPSNVLHKGLSSYIKSFKQTLLTDAELERIVAEIQNLKADRALNHRSHMKSLRERHSSMTTCPSCGDELVERRSKKGRNAGAIFLGCKSFPRCRYTQRA